MVCRQTDKTNVRLAGITRRKSSCTNPRKVHQFFALLSDFPHLDVTLCAPSSPLILGHSFTGAEMSLLFLGFEQLLCVGCTVVCKADLMHLIPSP